MTYQEVLENARGQMGPCKACPVCDGRACRNTIPGPGAKGTGDTAMRNYSAWQNIRVNMDTLCAGGEPDTGCTLLGRQFRLPVFAGPVGAVQLHYGSKYDDLAYNDLLIPACREAGILAFTGDGTNPAVMTAACKISARPRASACRPSNRGTPPRLPTRCRWCGIPARSPPPWTSTPQGFRF